MKNDLTCAVIADLLPSFVEGLTSDETNRAVEAHVASCPDCAAKLAAMRGPETETVIEVVPEVDYLKKVKKRTGRKVVLAVLCTALLLLAGFAAKVFVIGTPAQPEGLVVLTQEVDRENVMHLDVTTPWSGTAYHGWKVETNEGVVNIWARQVLVNPLFSGGHAQLEIPMDGVKEVYLCGRLIWQNGMAISPKVLALLEAKTPYLGDAPAVGNIAAVMDILNLVEDYTMELQTSERPYDWTLNFQKRGIYRPKYADALREKMEAFAPLMLALVDNLDQVSWTYTDIHGVVQTETLTQDEVNAALPEQVAAYNETHGTDWTAKASVKDYVETAADFQQLYQLVTPPPMVYG